MLSTILLIAIGVLLVVVLLPVGIAAARKIAARDNTLPTPTPRETIKIPPLPPPPPEPASTQIINLADAAAAPEQQGTTMMQWYGMLVCTGGPLEGQHFPIEEDGFYIGREPSLATVVVNETRVSKRHVRIMPRSGKVFAIDQNSSNGTFLKSAPGQRITEVQLQRGDEIVLADNAATFRYQI
jgi:hypothetical protein